MEMGPARAALVMRNTGGRRSEVLKSPELNLKLVAKIRSLARPPRQGIREDPGRTQLCLVALAFCILMPEILDCSLRTG